MNDRDYYTKEELLSEGWTERAIDAVFDQGDEYNPSGHWLNTTGSALYDPERVAVAAYREDIAKHCPPADVISRWLKSGSPTSKPILTLNFSMLINPYDIAPLRNELSTQLGNPAWGPFSSREEKSAFIQRDLVCLACIYLDEQVRSWRDFEDIAASNQRRILSSFPGVWRDDVCVRPAMLKSYISRAKSESAMHRAFDAMLLVQSGAVTTPAGNQGDLVELLLESRLLRFDKRCVDKRG